MFVYVPQIEDNIEKKILVLGLEGSGKSSILNHFTAPQLFQNGAQSSTGPTSGFNVVTLDNDGITLKIYESKSTQILIYVRIRGNHSR
jgi:GTPase SAR1 family protein